MVTSIFLRVCVGICGLTYSLYHPRGARSQAKKLSEKILTNPDAGEDKQVGEQVATNKKVEAVRVPLSPNWVDSWSLTEIREMQREDEISKVKKLKPERSDPPDKTTLFTEDNECKALCSQWNNLERYMMILCRGNGSLKIPETLRSFKL